MQETLDILLIHALVGRLNLKKICVMCIYRINSSTLLASCNLGCNTTFPCCSKPLLYPAAASVDDTFIFLIDEHFLVHFFTSNF